MAIALMNHLCIKYRLTERGEIPDFVCTEPNSLNGLHPVDTNTHSFPQELLMVGISKKYVSGDFEVISTKEALLEYLLNVGANWTVPDPSSEVISEQSRTPFDHSAAADSIWDCISALNAS